ncbi:ABC-three component system middle component 1 [Bacillus cereus]|uniref:ABC-three component system middle component 1 n=1 Tax=Bacillus cereus TaxID=1396 RepID=UPI000BFDA0F0|nr:ABC-three component system middle component 1 [Bacillus cereus]PGZ60180.1 hypothetical protein COF02_24010 [Bacillus cereus]
MKILIRKILEEKGFVIDESILEEERSFLASRTENNKFDFLTAMFISKDEVRREIIKEKIEEYLVKLIETHQTFTGIEKNLSLLLLIEVDSLEYSKEIASVIYDIEEDPYDFKKYVLSYTKQQVTLLKSSLHTLEENIIPFLNKSLNNPTLFSKFKNNEESEDVLIYDLVSKFYIKIPFLNIENNQQTITNLYENIVEEIDERDKGLWESLLKLNEISGDNPSVEEILTCIGVETID